MEIIVALNWGYFRANFYKKHFYLNGLANTLGMEKLELEKRDCLYQI